MYLLNEMRLSVLELSILYLSEGCPRIWEGHIYLGHNDVHEDTTQQTV